MIRNVGETTLKVEDAFVLEFVDIRTIRNSRPMNEYLQHIPLSKYVPQHPNNKITVRAKDMSHYVVMQKRAQPRRLCKKAGFGGAKVR